MQSTRFKTPGRGRYVCFDQKHLSATQNELFLSQAINFASMIL
jgi:predicted RNA-binding protein YlxR (DUF448 family)